MQWLLGRYLLRWQLMVICIACRLYNIMFKLFTLVSLCGMASCLKQAGAFHFTEAGFGGVIGFFFACAILAGCCYCYCKYCRGGGDVQWGRRSGHHHAHHRRGSSDYDGSRYRVPPPPPPPMPVYPIYTPPPVPVGRFNPPAPFVSQNDVTRALTQDALSGNWQGPDHFAKQRLRQSCGYCSSFSKYGQEPRLMLNCSSHHAFHIACFNQYRIANPNNGAILCPVCGETSSGKVRYFCPMCKQKYVWVDLVMFSDHQGVIDTTRMTGYYGEYCGTCRNR